MSAPTPLPASIDATLDLLAGADYLADRSLATVLFLALKMGRPLFLEGEAGVGKTEIAKVLSTTLGRRLIRLQCYEGLDVAAAVYEWNYAAQMIAIRVAEAEGAHDRERLEHDVFSERFLIKRPLLQALEPDPAGPPVLLIDELDRADEAFEAFLLEVLADFQVTIPELGTVKATHAPIVVITSNRTREIHDALKRRCLYHWVGYPSAERELKIVRAKVPGIAKALSEQIVHFVQALRNEDLFKSPGVAETLDWAAALAELDVAALDPATVSDTLGALLKYQDDIARIEGGKAKELLDDVRAQRLAEALLSSREEGERKPPQLEMDARLTVSDREVLRSKDFAQMTADEIAAAKDAIKRLVLSLDEVKTRRLAPHRHGHIVDIRRTLRASLKAGGAVIDLKYLGPRKKLPPIVALLDISGSMSQYTRLFLHFLHAVTDARKRVHTFLFGTRLTNVTRAIKAKDVDEALAAVSANVADWSGGTRIASSLAAFNKLWARRVLTQGAIVLLITDGLERDPDDRLAFEIDRLHRSCRRLIWLNPLLRFSGFEAKAKGIRAMLPHVDELRPIHNLDSMMELVRALSADGARPGDPKAWLDRVA